MTNTPHAIDGRRRAVSILTESRMARTTGSQLINELIVEAGVLNPCNTIASMANIFNHAIDCLGAVLHTDPKTIDAWLARSFTDMEKGELA